MTDQHNPLPPLPEAFGELPYQRPSGMWGRLEGYTSEQMTAYGQASRKAALEEAAKVARGTCHHESTQFANGFNQAALNIENVIKGLK